MPQVVMGVAIPAVGSVSLERSNRAETGRWSEEVLLVAAFDTEGRLSIGVNHGTLHELVLRVGL